MLTVPCKSAATGVEKDSREAGPAGASQFRVEVVTNLAAWERMAAAWNELLSSSGSNTVFLTWEWLFSWAECFLGESRKLLIIAVYKGEELLGAAPWYVQHTPERMFSMKQLQFLGEPETGSDYLDVIARRGKEQEVAECLYDFLFRHGRSLWDRLFLQDIPANSLFLLYFQNKIENEGKYAELNRGSYCPGVALRSTGEAFSSAVSAKRRARLRQDVARLKKNGDIKHRVHEAGAVSAGVDEFFSFYQSRTGRDCRHLHRFIGKLQARAASQNLLQIDFLTSGDRSIAALLHLRYENELFLWMMAVDKSFNPKISVGNVLVGLCLEHANERGVARYDFLKGNERYKFHWADGGRSAVTFVLTQKKLSPLLYTTGRFIKYTAKMLLR